MKRFFSPDSFWNQSIPADAPIDPRSERWMRMLEGEPTHENFYMNSERWTIPVYEASTDTPVVEVRRHELSPREKRGWATTRDTFGHGPGFGSVPIPAHALPDSQTDSHLAVVDPARSLVWDMWRLSRNPDGSWKSATGMVYAADGSGVFDPGDLDLVDGESVHFHGPSRASGVPAVAGLILYDEVMSGEIRHRIAGASRYCARREFVFPAIWTDGRVPGGIPEGSVIQLDPALDLDRFALTPEERIVATALQRHGLVLVDVAHGQAIYAEGLWGQPGRSWEGRLPQGGGIARIPYRHYRVLEAGSVTRRGDGLGGLADVGLA